MCGRYTQTAALEELARRFGIVVDDRDEAAAAGATVPRYNVAPSQPVPIVIAGEGGRRLLAARWGLRPPWLREGPLAPINARSETVASGRLFRDAFRRSRCLVPADGFYEWKAVPGQRRKQPYYLRLRGGGLFAFAGLWTARHPETGRPPTCAVITTSPNALCAEIHDRMPVILEPEVEPRWLDHAAPDLDAVLACLRPLPAERMEAWPVSSLVSSPRNDGPELIAPGAAPPPIDSRGAGR